MSVSRCSDDPRLSGAKIFCSGAEGLDAALVLDDGPDTDRTLLLVPIDVRLDVDLIAVVPFSSKHGG